MKLNEIGFPIGRKRSRTKRLGRGDGSGHGGTSGRGHKGQKARAGGYHKVGFEGGQMPLRRRLPKRGFTNIFRRKYSIVNLDQLKDFASGSLIDAKILIEKGIIRKKNAGVVILGRGEIANALKVKAVRVSNSARAKIESKGGTIEVGSV